MIGFQVKRRDGQPKNDWDKKRNPKRIDKKSEPGKTPHYDGRQKQKIAQRREPLGSQPQIQYSGS
jgi:hypothetical protein